MFQDLQFVLAKHSLYGKCYVGRNIVMTRHDAKFTRGVEDSYFPTNVLPRNLQNLKLKCLI
jgi:hypothetical protein